MADEVQLSGWGRYPRLSARLETARDEGEVTRAIAAGTIIARGNGRAYGDSAIGIPRTLDLRPVGRMLAFEEMTGQLVAESGTLFADIIATFLPRGWFPAVTPGTKFVSLGGAIAADVHGKNHHRDGGLANVIDWFDLACGDGVVRRCSRTENCDYFDWTLGGMGLTGIILRAAMRLRRVETGWIKQRLVPAPDLPQAMRIFEENQEANYSVAWIDCYAAGQASGRSIVMLGEHALRSDLGDKEAADVFAKDRKRSWRMPLDLPSGALNRHSVRLFNTLYYHRQRSASPDSLVAWDNYFYPLDAVLEWNRIYGRAGFAQFQCVLPDNGARAGLEALLAAIRRYEAGSFLAVLKRMGAEGSGLSFAMRGYTLALDFPINPRNLKLLDELDAISVDHGGRFYLAKDARMNASTFAAADPRGARLRDWRRTHGLADRFRSAQSERLEL